MQIDPFCSNDAYMLPDRAHRGSGGRIAIAAFKSGTTDNLSRLLGFPIAVISAVVDPARHAEELTRTWHGCWRPRERWFAPFDFWDVDSHSISYKQFAFDRRWMGSRAIPSEVSVLEGSLWLDIPSGTSRAAFAQAFALAMLERRFEAIAQQPGRVRYRYRTGRPLEIGSRYSLDPSFYGDLPELAEDLYAFEPRNLPGLVDAALRAQALLKITAAYGSAASPVRARACE